MPFLEDLRTLFGWAPAWVFSLVVLAALLATALVAYTFLVRAVRRGLRGRSPFTRSLIVRTREPARLAIVLAAIAWAVQIAPLSQGVAALVQHIVLVGVIVLIGWALLAATDIAMALYMRRFKVDVADNLLARKHMTQVRILRRALAVLVVILTIGIALMTIPGVRRVGVSLLAAGGAAGIIVGLALQPVLSNLIAGVQIALTQPIRLDDAVVINGEFGRVEEITGTYVVIRLWDLRRLVVPLKFFLDQPFQNWTRESSALLGTVMFYLDYTAPIDRIRAHLEEVVRGRPKWNGEVCNLQVTDARERTLEVRALVSAGNSGDLFDLRCEVREAMIGWLQAELPDALPRDRLDLAGAERPAELAPGARPADQRVQ